MSPSTSTPLPTASVLHEMFLFDVETGSLERRDGRKGRRSGRQSSGPYLNRRVNGRLFRSHRIIWEMFYGPVPPGAVIDHVNGDTQDNRLENLRVATREGNSANSRVPVTTTSGFKGVSFLHERGKFRAYITHNKKRLHLGYFDDPRAAAKAYDEAAVRLFGAFAKTNIAQGLYE